MRLATRRHRTHRGSRATLRSALLGLALGALGGAARAQDPAPWDGLWERGERLTAIAALEPVVAAEGDPLLTLQLAHWQLAVHRYLAARETADALGEAGRAVRSRSHYLLGDYELALDELDAADPLEARMIVDALEVLGRDELLEAALDEARETVGAEDPDLLAARGRLLARQGDHAGALAAFERALDGDAVHAVSLHGAGRALLRLGRRDEAEVALARHRELVPLMDALDQARRSLDLDPLRPSHHAQLGDVERGLGRWEAADRAYRRATELASGAELTPIVLRHARLWSDDRGDVDRAVELLKAGAERHPDVRLAVRAGDLLLSAGRPAEALSWYEDADRVRPGDGQIAQRLRAARLAVGSDG